MQRADKWYYPRRLFTVKDGYDEERDKFHEFLDYIRESAVQTETRWEDFYHYTTYTMTMAKGQVYEYCEDNDYMIPYSITIKKGEPEWVRESHWKIVSR